MSHPDLAPLGDDIPADIAAAYAGKHQTVAETLAALEMLNRATPLDAAVLLLCDGLSMHIRRFPDRGTRRVSVRALAEVAQRMSRRWQIRVELSTENPAGALDLAATWHRGLLTWEADWCAYLPMMAYETPRDVVPVED